MHHVSPPVHPHTRGDYLMVSRRSLGRCGSPPHAWGLQWSFTTHPTSASVHPHTRGDYKCTLCHVYPSTGSPPHAWGLLYPAFSRVSATAGSPPHAWGLRQESGTVGLITQVHPHTRGDYFSDLGLSGARVGSPPHAWGLLKSPISGQRPTAVHPHTRGDYTNTLPGSNVASWFTPTRVGITSKIAPCSSAVSGSPPHAWGLLRRTRRKRRLSAIHPHTRGDYGKRHNTASCQKRFTPTRVGITPNKCPCHSPDQVHPHTRGDYKNGKFLFRISGRFTPTRVGITRSRLFCSL